MFSLKKDWFVILLMLITVISGIVLYPSLPDQVPSHWNVQGQIDQYTSPLGHIISFSGIMLGMLLLFIFLPKLEPRLDNLKKSMGFYDMMKNLLISFFFILYAAITYSSVQGINIPIDIVISIPLGILFIVMGNYMSQIKSNYFMGVRTPWTLQSDEVWKKTHRLSGRLFIVSGVLFLTQVALPKPWGYYTPIAFLMLSSLYLVIYSLVIYRKNSK